MTELTKQELLDAIKYGHPWHMKRIADELEKVIAGSSNSHLELRWADDERGYYLYDSECYLFVEDGAISTRSEKDNVASTDKTVDSSVNSIDDIKAAFQRFIDLTLEEEK